MFCTQIHTFTELCWTCEPDPVVITNPTFLIGVYTRKPVGGVIAATKWRDGCEDWPFFLCLFYLFFLFSHWLMLILLKKSVWTVGGGLSRDSLDLDSYWLRTDLTRVHVQKVTEELVVPISWRIIMIKPPSLTFWNRGRNKKMLACGKTNAFFSRLCVVMTTEAFSVHMWLIL